MDDFYIPLALAVICLNLNKNRRPPITVRAVVFNAWWDNRFKDHFPVTNIRIESSGRLYVESAKGIYNVDKQRTKLQELCK